MFLNQVSAQQVQQPQDSQPADPFSIATLQQQQQQVLANQQAALYGTSTNEVLNNSMLDASQQGHSTSFGQGVNGVSNGASTIGGLLAPANARAQHARAVSLPVFSQENSGNGQYQNQQQQQHGQQQPSHRHQQSSFSGTSGFGGFGNVAWGLNGWAEEDIPGTLYL